MRRSNISGTREIRKQIYIYIDAGGSKSMRALTRDQQYIYFVRLNKVNQFRDKSNGYVFKKYII